MYMDEHFGAWPIENAADGGFVEFKVFMPDRAHDAGQYEPQPADRTMADYGDPKIVSIQVAGSFQPKLQQTAWDFSAAPQLVRQPHPKGWAWVYRTPVKISPGYYEYKYLVTFEDGTQRKISDPCTRYGGTAHQNSAFTTGGSSIEIAIKPVAGGRKPLRDLVIYELMIDDFTDEYRGARAPIDAVRDKLDYLKDQLGVNAILFMPWTAWPGEGFNWGYTPYLYFSVEYRYANALNRPVDKLVWLKASDQRMPRARPARDHGRRVQSRRRYERAARRSGRLSLSLAVSEPGRLPVRRAIRRCLSRLARSGFSQRLHAGVHPRRVLLLDRSVWHRRHPL